jgi:ACS family allantoate permease-like MFS transporter
MLSAYCVGNLVGPQMWQEQYKPRYVWIRVFKYFGFQRFTPMCRNRIPWIVITISYFLCPVILLVIRFRLSRENKKRDMEPKVEQTEDAYIEEVLEDGTKVERRIDKVR